MTRAEYLDDCRLEIEAMRLRPGAAPRLTVALETACADDIMNGCAAELLGVRSDNVTPACRERIAAVIAACRGLTR